MSMGQVGTETRPQPSHFHHDYSAGRDDGYGVCACGARENTKASVRVCPRFDVRARIDQAMQHIFDLSAGRKTWRMCVPVQDDDSDTLLADALAVARYRIEELEGKR